MYKKIKIRFQFQSHIFDLFDVPLSAARKPNLDYRNIKLTILH